MEDIADEDKFKDDKARLFDIAKSIEEIGAALDGIDFETFLAEENVQEEVTTELSLLGGAATLLSEEFMEQYGDVDWVTLKLLKYAAYDEANELDPHALWYIIENDLPLVRDQVLDITTVLQDREDREEFIW